MDDLLEYIRGSHVSDINYYMLTEKEIYIVYYMLQMLDNNYTFRSAEKNLSVSKSSLHRYVHDKLPHISIELYDQIIAMIKRHRNQYTAR